MAQSNSSARTTSRSKKTSFKKSVMATDKAQKIPNSDKLKKKKTTNRHTFRPAKIAFEQQLAKNTKITNKNMF